MTCDQGCNPTAEKKISKRENTELRACFEIFDQAFQRLENVEGPERMDQNTTVTTMGNVMMVVKRRVWASWKGRHHLLRGDTPVREYQIVSPPAKRK